MAVDPLTSDILLFTKDHEGYESHVFRVPHEYGDPKTLEYVTTLPYKLVTGEFEYKESIKKQVFKNGLHLMQYKECVLRCRHIPLWRHPGPDQL